jgi:pyruvate formate lyase activating enzyme
MGTGELGYCGLRRNDGGSLFELSSHGTGRLHTYLDRLPTNCCSSWFCRGSQEDGYNLAVFLYGCSFDCLYCQNADHKRVDTAPSLSDDELVEQAMDPRVRCVCYFGGSPEPQFPFVLNTAERILQRSDGGKHLCFEWNGSGREDLIRRSVELARSSGGTVKFDLKAFHPKVHAALCGVCNDRTLSNFRVAAGMFPDEDVVTATTLLVSYYVDDQEVDGIARMIGEVNPNMPYSLLVFHPDFFLDDLPVTPGEQVRGCLEAARGHVGRVFLGNRSLLQG